NNALKLDPYVAKGGEITLGHEAWMDVRKEPGLGERRRAHRLQRRQRRAVAARLQELAVVGGARLRAVAQRAQRDLGPAPPSRLTQRDDFVRRHGVGARLTRIAAERAIPAVVAAERRERHEDLRGERHHATAGIARLGGAREEVVEARGRTLHETNGLVVGDHARGAFMTLPRTSWAKRSMFVSAALRSGTVGSK